MTATTATDADQVPTGRPTQFAQIPLSRVVRVELRKMFDTRSGFWLIASIGITGLIATIATIAFAPDNDLTYYNFAAAIGFPITVILPMIALLSITSEWSQRTGLTTFTYVPSRRRVVMAKTWSAVIVAIASMLFAFAVGAVATSSAAPSPARRRSGISLSPTPPRSCWATWSPCRSGSCSGCCSAAQPADS